MNKKIGLLIFVSMLLMSTIYMAEFITSIETQGNTYVYPDDFLGQTLRQAIENETVKDGDTIIVRTGTWYEPTGLLAFNKSITFEGFHRTSTIINNASFYILTDGVTIRELTIQNAYTGISIESDHNSIVGNIIKNNYYGIWVDSSTGNNLTDNEIKDNTYNFGVEVPSEIESGTISLFLHEIDNSNTVDGKPIYYWVNHNNEQIPSDAGYVAVVNSTNITVKNLDLKNNMQGVVFAYTKDSTIENVNSSYTEWYGIYLHNSSNNVIADNVASGNGEHGILLVNSSSNNVIADNVASDNALYGICLYDSNNNLLTGNDVSNTDFCMVMDHASNNVVNGNKISHGGVGIVLTRKGNANTIVNNVISDNEQIGIALDRSNRSIFYHNNVINNPTQVFTYQSSNAFDNGHEGNYWSDYSGTDGNGDGIGDTPYEITLPDNVDRYPLIIPWGPTRVFEVKRGYKHTCSVTTFSNSTLASFNFNKELKQISLNITSGANGFCNITIPRDWLDGPFELFINDVPTDFDDINQNATHCSLYFTYGPCTKHIKIRGTRLTHIIGDVNNDGIVDIFDCVIIGINYGYEK